MRMRREMFAAFVMLVLVVGAIIGIYYYMDYVRVDYRVLDYIYQFQTEKFTFSDIGGDISVESVNDIGYSIEGYKRLQIYYGKQRIKVNKHCFDDQQFRQKLGKIGIVIKTHENDDGTLLYKVTCWDEEIDCYSLAT